MIATTYHGETETLFYVIDDDAPQAEQPAVVATVSTSPPDVRTMTHEQIQIEQDALKRFQWTDECYTNPTLREWAKERVSVLDRRCRQIEFKITPLVLDDARRDAYDKMTANEIMRRFPNLVAHLICESLGYATPTHAAQILKRAIVGDPDYCEWIDACHRNDPTRPVRFAMQGRHGHKGYMADYRHARLLVYNALEHDWEPVFASWF